MTVCVCVVISGCLYGKKHGFCVCLLFMCVLWDHVCEFAMAVPSVNESAGDLC